LGYDLEELVQLALSSNARYAAIADTSGIIFHEEFRKACEKNVCGMYNTNWMGPPAIGPISQLKEIVETFSQGLLFQTVHHLSGSFDWRGMKTGQEIHDGIFRDILRKIKEEYHFDKILPLNAGCCKLCPRCAYLDEEPCRHPDQAVSSVEGYGIDVMALEKSCGIPYYNGRNTVSYVGLILFHKEEK
jgi:predicted metal-binding protein